MGTGSDKRKPPAPETGNDADTSGGTQEDMASNTAEDSSLDDVDQEPALTEGNALPQTCCSNCRTVFEVSPELLASSDTRVRCGECLSIFDALSNLRTDELSDDGDHMLDEDGEIIDPDGSYARVATQDSDDFMAEVEEPSSSDEDQEDGGDSANGDDSSALDMTYSDFDLFSGEAGLPEVAYFDQTQDLDHLRFDEPDGDETFSDTLFAHDMTVEPPEVNNEAVDASTGALDVNSLDTRVGFVTDDVQRDPLVFKYRDPDNNSDPSAPTTTQAPSAEVIAESTVAANTATSEKPVLAKVWLLRSVLFFLVAAIAMGLYGYRQRDAIVHDPQLRPLLVKACALIRCELPPLVDLDALKVLKRSVFSHPTEDNALVIDLAFVSQARFDQPYPVLEIRLTDRNGRLVEQNIVTPAEYLDQWQSGDMLLANKRLDLSLTVEDPGQTATSFELKFR